MLDVSNCRFCSIFSSFNNQALSFIKIKVVTTYLFAGVSKLSETLQAKTSRPMTGCWRTRNRQPDCRRLEFSALLLRVPFSDAATARTRLEKLIQVFPGSSFLHFYLLLVFSHISCLQVANLLKKKISFRLQSFGPFPSCLGWDASNVN